MIKFACSNCNRSVRVDDKYAGQKGKCPKCGAAIVVPERSTVIEFHCASCGHRIKVPDRYAGKKGMCPKCNLPVAVPVPEEAPVEASAASSGGLASEPEAAVRSEADEDLCEAPAAAPETSGGPNRRLLILIGGAAIVVIVGVIGFMLFRWSAGSPRAEKPVPVRPRADVTPVEPQTQPVAATPRSAETTAPESAEAVRLQFRPGPGAKQTLRVTTRMDMSVAAGPQKQDITNTQSFAVDLEAREAHADGSIPIGVTLAQIQVKTEMAGVAVGEYDSTQPQSEDDSLAGTYVSFVGTRFTVRVSGRGEIIDPGLDALFLAVAAGRMEAEDDMMRELLKEKAQAAIEKTDQRFGSRKNRTLALKKQLEEFPIFGSGDVRSLLDHLIVALPDGPLQSGTSWTGPVAVRVGAPLEMPATHTVTALDEDSCTITAQGQRSLEEEPFVYQTGPITVSNKLGGSSQMRLTVDRQTGWLRTKEQTTTLRGRILRTRAEAPGEESFSDVAMEITTTVTPVDNP